MYFSPLPMFLFAEMLLLEHQAIFQDALGSDLIEIATEDAALN